MTRKEEIKEVAQKEMSKYPNFCITAPAFRMGAEWADSHPHWISVEEELPPKKSEYDDLSNNVLATDGKEIYESVYNHNFEEWFTHDMWGLDNIAYWMPLPEAPTVAKNATVKEKGGEE